MSNLNHEFTTATLSNMWGKEPQLRTWTIQSLIDFCRTPSQPSAAFQEYHDNKQLKKLLDAEVTDAHRAGDSERHDAAKAFRKKVLGWLDQTKSDFGLLPYTYKNDVLFTKHNKGPKKGESTRTGTTQTGYTLIILDLESNTTIAEIHSVIGDYEYLLWPTIGHRSDDPRYRVVLFPAATLSNKDGFALLTRIDALLPLRYTDKKTRCIDGACLDELRIQYTPRYFADNPEPYKLTHNAGKLLTKHCFPVTEEQQAEIDARTKPAESSIGPDPKGSKHGQTVAQPIGGDLHLIDGEWRLHPDAYIETNEGYIRFGDIDRKIGGARCPGHVDGNASEYVFLNNMSKRPQLYCKNCKNIRMLTDAQLDRLEGDKPSTLTLNLKKKEATTKPSMIDAVRARSRQLPPPIHQQITYFPGDVLLNLNDNGEGLLTHPQAEHRFLQPDIDLLLPEHGIIAIRSPKGTGKTEMLKRIVTAAKATRRSSVLLGHRVFLLSNIADRADLSFYKNLDVDKITSFMAICMNSLHRIGEHASIDYDTVIIDESEQVFLNLRADHVKGVLGEVLAVMRVILQRAKRIILLDADLSSFSLDVLRQFRYEGNARGAELADTDEVFGIDNSYQIGQGQTTHIFETQDQLLARLLLDIERGEKVFVASNFRSTAARIAAMARSLDKRVLLITSATSADTEKNRSQNPEVFRFIDTPTEEAMNWDVVVCSPTLSTGVSLDAGAEGQFRHFTKVYGFFYVQHSTFQDADQALSRVRYVNEHNVWFQQHQTLPKFKEPEEVYSQLMRIELQSRRTKSTLNSDELRWLEIATRIDVALSHWGNYKLEQFVALRDRLGFTVLGVDHDEDEAAVGKEYWELFPYEKASTAAEIFDAPIIDDEECDKLMRKSQRTYEEQLQILRWRYVHHFGADNVTLDLIEGHEAARSLQALSALKRLLKSAPDVVKQDDAQERKKNRSAFTSNTHAPLRQQFLDELIKAASIDLQTIYSELAQGRSPEMTKSMEALAHAYERKRTEYNLHFRLRIKETENKKAWRSIWNGTIGEIRNSASLVLNKPVRTTIDGVRDYYYFLETTSEGANIEGRNKLLADEMAKGSTFTPKVPETDVIKDALAQFKARQ